VPTIAAKRKAASKRRYGAAAKRKVASVMHEMQQGTLKSGRSGKKVSSRKQAIAIGLSEARKAGAKVPAKGKAVSKRKSTGKRKATPGKRKVQALR
jgi:hypothetical protein